MTHVQPYHQFKVTVAQSLQKRWPGAAGYQLAAKYDAIVHQAWLDMKLADEAATQIDAAYMARPVEKFSMPTRKSMEAAGCKFHK